MAAGAGPGPVREHGPCVDLLGSDPPAGFPAGPGEGELGRESGAKKSQTDRRRCCEALEGKQPCMKYAVLWLFAGVGHQTPTAQEETAAGSSGPWLRGGGQQGKAGLQLGDQ